jgi:lipopolysaccharide transport system ATP-binding protein
MAVKHYSSGMYMRLAFAVAAHLEPDILVVDEVLAVGDASFQRKCLGKMADVAGHGRTVLFVSHNMPAVTRLCNRAILLDQGQVIDEGPTARVAGAYLRGGTGTTAERRWEDPAKRPGDAVVRIHSARVLDQNLNVQEVATITRKVGIELVYEVLVEGPLLVPILSFQNEEGICLFVAIDGNEDRRTTPRPRGVHRALAWCPPNLFAEGTVVVDVAVSSFDPLTVHFHERDAVAFQVVEPAADEGGVRHGYAGPMPGVLRPRLTWETDNYHDDRFMIHERDGEVRSGAR